MQFSKIFGFTFRQSFYFIDDLLSCYYSDSGVNVLINIQTLLESVVCKSRGHEVDPVIQCGDGITCI